MNRDFDLTNAVERRVQPRWQGQSRGVAAAVVALAVLVLAGCTSSGAPTGSAALTQTQTVTHTRPAPSAFTPAPAATVRPLPPGAKAHAGEKDGSCPYIKAGLNVDDGTGTNLADIEGDRVYRVTRLSGYHPVGCRFYFYAPPYEAVADIRPLTFATPTDAYNAMVRTANAGTEQLAAKDFVPGLTGVSFRTMYFGPDGRRDWAFVFAKGRIMVGVYTQRLDTSQNALYIARAIAGKF
jgi:hypothetical protein